MCKVFMRPGWCRSWICFGCLYVCVCACTINIASKQFCIVIPLCFPRRALIHLPACVCLQTSFMRCLSLSRSLRVSVFLELVLECINLMWFTFELCQFDFEIVHEHLIFYARTPFNRIIIVLIRANAMSTVICKKIIWNWH